MAINQKRPDTPLAPTPEPTPVSMGQVVQRPVNKYQATADAAIQQLSQMNKPQAPEQPETPQ